MKIKSILIIGGTRFVGRIVIEKLLKEKTDCKITVFNRGITNKSLFQEEKAIDFIYGDRESKDIEQLFSRKWDVVIDFMGYFPDSLAYLLSNINQNIGRYIFISTISVYDLENPSSIPITENGRLLNWKTKDRTDSSWESYGQRKVACEEEIQKVNDLDFIILRPSLIYGKYDYTDRFYYWLYRIKYEKELETPEDFNKLITYTFSEDFANVIIQFIEAAHSESVYNVITHTPKSLTKLLNDTNRLLKSSCEILPVLKATDDFETPLWFPQECLEISSIRLHNEFELNFYSLEDSLRRTLSYADAINWPKPNLL